MPTTRPCRAKNPAACRYHGSQRQQVTEAVAATSRRVPGKKLPDRLVKSGSDIGERFTFANSLKGGYKPARHQPPINIAGDSFTWTKPGGGLWLSTIGESGVSSWRELWGGPAPKGFIEREVRFKADARVVVIDSLADYRAILDRYPHYPTATAAARDYATSMGDLLGGGMSTVNPDGSPKRAMDFEALANDYDAIVLSWDGLYTCGRQDFRGHMGKDMSLYLWDIESAFVLNSNAITFV